MPVRAGPCATLACILEATAGKPGNVHRGADFDDLTYFDFLAAALAIGPAMEAASAGAPVGKTVLSAVRATREATGTNVNLGTVLLLAPLAKVPPGGDWHAGVRSVLCALTPGDARDVYAAIAVAQPGGLGKVGDADVAGPPPADLVAAMRLAEDRDLVARQYSRDFAEVLGEAVPLLHKALDQRLPLADAIVRTYLELLSRHPDSLVARKCGPEMARRISDQAAAVLASGVPGDVRYETALADFDFFLRSDGHRRNPGTTADLIAAALFVALRDGWLGPPFRFYGSGAAPAAD
ncbi:MAG: triphosphoribosyl-dephospho-CoA synthase [Planctomycetia bacterium]|nr:triphosphoribosyl-dephospho-CoA synthase [Planctomycetia bacterium]